MASHSPPRSTRRRGRTAIMTRDALLESVRRIAGTPDGLFRIHRRHPDLYGRARRMFGSWGEAVRLAGVDYESVVDLARRRSRVTLRERARARRANVMERSRGGNHPETAH
jgi:hypothetical protein